MAIQALRRGSKSWVVKGILILIAISFAAFFGVSDNPFQRTTQLVKVGSEDVGVNEIATAFNREMQNIAPLLGGQLTTEQAVRLGLLDQAISRVVARNLFELGARDSGVVIGTQQVAGAIRSSPQFQSGVGFDRLAYETYLARNGLSEGEFVALLSQDLSRQQYVGSIRAGQTAPRPLLDTVYRYREERRVADVAVVLDAAMADPGTPDETALMSYYDGHPDAFMAPEYRALTIAALSPEELALEIAVDEAEVAEAYELRRVSYETPERRTVDQALFEDQASAQRAAALIGEGRTFDGAVEEVTGEAPIALGEVGRAELFDVAVADAVFGAAVDTPTAPVEGPFGWAIYRVSAVSPGSVRTFEEVREELAAELALERARDDIFEVMNTVDDVLAGGASIEEAASASAVRVVTTAAIAQDGTGRDGQRVGGVASESAVLEIAFATENGFDSLVSETPAGGFFVVRVDGVTEAAVRPLDEVRDDAIAAWQADQRRTAAQAKADAVVDQLEAGEVFTRLAPTLGLTVSRSAPITRAGGAEDTTLPAAMLAPLFDARSGDALTGDTEVGVAVAQLVEVRRAGTATGEAGETLRSGLGVGLANDLEAQLGAALQSDYGVEVDRVAIENIFTVN